jgi:hypothetical protein
VMISRNFLNFLYVRAVHMEQPSNGCCSFGSARVAMEIGAG